METIPATDTERWHAALAKAGQVDCYHLPEYHLLAEERGEGKGLLFVYREGTRVAAWPFLLRPVSVVSGLESFRDLHDASSVYGYPGPVGSPNASQDAGFARRFGASLQRAARELRLVCMFSRLNPFIDSLGLAGALGTIREAGETVWVDLSTSPEAQWAGYRANHRRDILEARQRGLAVHRDSAWTHLDDFVRLYRITMERVGADPYYLFDRHYFLRLREALGERLQLFVATLGDTVPCAALAIHGGTTVHYHLGGSDPSFRELAAMKVVLDEMRLWGHSAGARILHLGGGVGCRSDSLFHFKAGFSPLRQQYRVWSHIVDPVTYEQLVQARRDWLAAQGLTSDHCDFFPQYRAGPSEALTSAKGNQQDLAHQPASSTLAVEVEAKH